MASLEQYTFRFDGESEVHYLARAPELGDRVSHGRDLWVVADLSRDGVGVIVVCRPPTNPSPGGNGRAVEAHIARR